jgi:hypothetical protein
LPKLLGGNPITTRPVLLQFCALTGKQRSQLLHEVGHQCVGSLNRRPRLVHEMRLDLAPADAKAL